MQTEKPKNTIELQPLQSRTRASSRTTAAVVLIGVGVIALLMTMGLFSPDQFFTSFGRTMGQLGSSIGQFFGDFGRSIGQFFGDFGHTLGRLWPVILIALGALLLLRRPSRTTALENPDNHL